MSSNNLINKIQPAKYVVAVSGGVDSIALLYALKDLPGLELLIVHVNHGIRPDEQTKLDEDLVRGLCKQWNIEFDIARLELGTGASEELARIERHNYLKHVLKSKNYNKIITAHHKDDVIETMIINLLRGTGRKGLSSLKNDDIYLRPLIETPKEDIIEYAKLNNLKWNEDSTNIDQTILRNYIRLTLIPKMLQKNTNIQSEFFGIHKEMLNLNKNIDSELAKLAKDLSNNIDDTFDRTKIIMLPIEVSFSFIHHILTEIYDIEVDSKMLKQVRNFIHTAKNGKIFNVNKNLNLTCQSKTISFTLS